jgi:hypothetical protein
MPDWYKKKYGHMKEDVEIDEAIRHEIAGAVGQFIGNKIDPVHGDIMRMHGKEAYRQAAYHIRKTVNDVKDAVSSLHDRLHKQLRTGGLTTEDVEIDEARYPGFRPGLGLGKRGAPSQRDNYKDFNDGRPFGFTPIKDKKPEEPKKMKEEVELDEVSADVAKRVAQARDRSAVANKLTSTQSRRLKMGDKGGDPDMNAAKALKSAMKRGAKNVYGEEVEQLDEKNAPTNPELWSRAKSLAKSKFDVYPCVPLDSLAISKKGPIAHDELEIGDEILTFNMKEDKLEWKPVLHKHYYENAPLMEIGKPTGFSIRCTPNHKWVISRTNDMELVETKDLNTHMKIIMCSVLQNDSNLLIENWTKKDNWIEKVLSMNEKEREIFLASSVVYDGWDKGLSTKIKDRHTFGFVQKEYDHLWASLLSAYLNGYYVNTNEKSDITGATYIRNKKYHSTQNLYKKDAGSEDVWCPTTENETWVMIQNGLITITGNSAYANGWASKWYKSKGGGWKSVSEETELGEGYFKKQEIERQETERLAKKDDPPFTPDKPKKRSVVVGKKPEGYSIARQLARQAMQKYMKKPVKEEAMSKKAKIVKDTMRKVSGDEKFNADPEISKSIVRNN